MFRFNTLTSLIAAAVVVATSTTVSAVEPVKLRWASDHSGPPHPAGIAEVYFAEQVEKKIPGSKVQIFWAKSLYTIPMTQGNLEMITGQFGKTASVEPLANVLLGAGKLTTVGAIDSVDTTDTYKELVKVFNDDHDITLFGAGHLSMYMGAGAVDGRVIAPADFAGKKMRSMGPAENALLGALGANPQSMAFGDVPPALQTGVIDGLLTSLGGFNAVDFIPFQRGINYCNDQRMLSRFETKDKTAPGIYVMNDEEAAAMKAAEGGATNEWIKTKVDERGAELVDQFSAEAEALVKANPTGSHALEATVFRTCKKFDRRGGWMDIRCHASAAYPFCIVGNYPTLHLWSCV